MILLLWPNAGQCFIIIASEESLYTTGMVFEIEVNYSDVGF